MEPAFIELHDGILVNLNYVNYIEPTSKQAAPDSVKTWNVVLNNKSVTITNDEYNMFKKYYKNIYLC